MRDAHRQIVTSGDAGFDTCFGSGRLIIVRVMKTTAAKTNFVPLTPRRCCLAAIWRTANAVSALSPPRLQGGISPVPRVAVDSARVFPRYQLRPMTLAADAVFLHWLTLSISPGDL